MPLTLAKAREGLEPSKFLVYRTLMENLTILSLFSTASYKFAGAPGKVRDDFLVPGGSVFVPAVGRHVTRNYFRTSSLREQGLGSLRRGWIMKPSSLGTRKRARTHRWNLRSLSQRSSSLQADFRVMRRVSMRASLLSSSILSPDTMY